MMDRTFGAQTNGPLILWKSFVKIDDLPSLVCTIVSLPDNDLSSFLVLEWNTHCLEIFFIEIQSGRNLEHMIIDS